MPARRDATVETRAAGFDRHREAALVDETPTHGDAVAPARRGAWIAFREVDFGPGVARVVARVARRRAGGTTLRFRLDDPAGGPTIARLTVPSTGDRHGWTTISAAVRGASGTHDLYLVLGGEASLASFRFERA